MKLEAETEQKIEAETEQKEEKEESEQEAEARTQGNPVAVSYTHLYCRRIAPAFDKIAEQQEDKLVFAKVNVDEAPEIAEKYGIEM